MNSWIKNIFKGFFAGVATTAIVFIFFSIVFAQGTPSDQAPTPKIARITPQSGGVGQYVTLEGASFGFVPGEVTFVKGSQVYTGGTDFIEECKQIWWRDTAIVVKVPHGVQEGSYSVKVRKPDSESANTVSFIVTKAAPNPGICGLVPDNGPEGTPLKVFGEGFGSETGRLIAANTDIPIADGDWTPNRINARMPALDSAPWAIRVVTKARILSNPVLLTSVARCISGQCGVGQQCCSDGSCRLSGMCQESVALCKYTWNFFTGDRLGIGDACANNDQCVSGACTNGICARGQRGIDQACEFDAQCTVGLKCELGVCARAGKGIGEICVHPKECASGRCENGICAGGAKKSGEACKQPEECKTKNCFNGVCAQSLRCVSIEDRKPKGNSPVPRNSVVSIRFNQIVREDTVRPNVRIEPNIPGRLDVTVVGTEDAAKTQVTFHPKDLLSPKIAYRLIVGDGVMSASSKETLGKCSLRSEQKCSTAGAVCEQKGGICTNGARCIGGTAVCSGKGTICTGPGSKCLDGALCTGTGSTCIGADTECTNVGSICRARAECSGANSKCEGLGTRCTADGSQCKEGAACVGKKPITTAKPAVCDKNKQTCDSVGAQCSQKSVCAAIDSTCRGVGTVCAGNGSACSAGSTCTGSQSQCSSPGTTCTGSDSHCSSGAKCTGIDSTCSGAGTQCTGNGSQCSSGASCSGAGSQCSGASTSCSGVGSQCSNQASCPANGNGGVTAGCDEGMTRCADNICRSSVDPVCRPSSCNANGACDANESCSCSDCFGQQSSCQTGFACSRQTQSCQATITIQALRSNARCDITAPDSVSISSVFSSQILLRNTGTIAWDPAVVALSTRNPSYSTLWGTATVALPPLTAVQPEGRSEVTVQGVAPAAAGTYLFSWQLHKGDEWIGEQCSKNIRVSVPPSGATCNNNTRCESGESCSCADCSTKQECNPDPSVRRCGNGVREEPEQCDDGNSDTQDACTNQCRGNPGFCRNGLVEAGEQCDDGDNINNNACSNNCRSNRTQCGNGVKEAVEQCDDGNTIDFDLCRNNCTTNRNRPICGDKIRELGEQCDDGNQDNTDACRADCIGNPGQCGNGTRDSQEECDDGDTNDTNACTNQCTGRPNQCGNGSQEGNEQCDDGDTDNANSCKNDCTSDSDSAQCGNGIKEGIESCDDKDNDTTNACKNDCTPNPSGCGNGTKDGFEECDDGDKIHDNACRNDCTLNLSGGSLCGNGNQEGNEECDDGNQNNTDSCRNDCRGNPRQCGNGMVETGEQCDDGDTDDSNGCRNNCMPRNNQCGNGTKEGTEQCDDGDSIDNDQCRNDCTINTVGPVCGNGVQEDPEECDDGNQNNTDACRADCIGNSGFCGNGIKEGAESCDDSNQDNTDACTNSCTPNDNRCGNGKKEGAEECDDGDSIENNQCKNDCRLNRTVSVCGNGIQEDPEQCDDGDDNNTNACRNDCMGNSASAVCGNGALEQGEECDDGDNDNTNECSNSCRTASNNACGNGIQEGGEQCDDGNTITTDSCRNDCTGVLPEQNNARCSITAPTTIRIAPNEFETGHLFTARIRLQNTGTKTWRAAATPAYTIRSASPLDNTFWSKRTIAFPDSKQNVAPKDFLDISVSLIAPVVSGEQALHWQLMEGEQVVGERCMLAVKLEPEFTNDAECTLTAEPLCGDGIREGQEQCDDGDHVDDNACSNDCMKRGAGLLFCGNGLREGIEECDDGNLKNNDRCRTDCIVNIGFCGNGLREGAESCDDGNTVDTDHCTNTCTRRVLICGNSIREAGEQCDDGNSVDDDACTSACKRNAGFCGNGVIESPESCDDGDRIDTNSCMNDCSIRDPLGPVCGNAKTEQGEQCDDGNVVNIDACQNNCQLFVGFCGNGAKEGIEECDDGDRVNSNRCRNDCTLQAVGNRFCTDGRRDQGEQCDDGNNSNTDSCRSDCLINTGFCGNGLRDGNEICDDGNREDADACTNRCTSQSVVVVADKDFALQFRIKNTGTKTWNPSTHVFAIRESGGVRLPDLDTIPLSSSVPPGGIINFGVRPYTPQFSGVAALVFQMKEKSAWFGESCRKSIRLQSLHDDVVPGPTSEPISSIELSVNGSTGATDTFTCSLDQGCADDIDAATPGNQHIYAVRALAADGAEISPKSIQWSSVSDILSLLEPINTATLKVMPKQENGNALVSVVVTGDTNEQMQASIAVTNNFEAEPVQPPEPPEPPEPDLCGNGIVDTQAGEQCDFNDLATKDQCTSQCRLEQEPPPEPELCGNGTKEGAEQCDDGDRNDANACKNDCTTRSVDPGVQEKINSISSIRIASNGDYLERDAFGCIGNSCADDADVSRTGNQHKIVVEFFDVDGKAVFLPDNLISWIPPNYSTGIQISSTSGKSIFVTNSEANVSGTIKVSITGSDPLKEKELAIDNKHPRRECLTKNRNQCVGGPDKQGNPQILERVVIDANDRPLDPDVFTCFGNSCKNDQQASRPGNQRAYTVRLHGQNNSLFDFNAIESIEWSLSATSSFTISAPSGVNGETILLTNTESDGTATLAVTVTPKDGMPLTSSITVRNSLNLLQIRDILISTNGQFLTRDAFGCVGNACFEDRVRTNSPGNQHELSVFITDGTRMLTIDPVKVHWRMSGPFPNDENVINLSSTTGTTITATNTTLEGSIIVTASVDGISAIGSLAIENKHPYQQCQQGSLCSGLPLPSGPERLDRVTPKTTIIDSNGRPLSVDRFTCHGRDCPDRVGSSNLVNTHRYTVRLHAKNNTLFDLDEQPSRIQKITWDLSSSPAFKNLKALRPDNGFITIENTDIPGTATLTVTIVPKGKPVQTVNMVLVNDTSIPYLSAPPEPELCGNGIVDTQAGEQCDFNDPATKDQCTSQCRLKELPPGPQCVLNAPDGVREPPEQCDDGNQDNTDACKNSCQGNPNKCGNGTKEGVEQCDDGDRDDANACKNDCTIPVVPLAPDCTNIWDSASLPADSTDPNNLYARHGFGLSYCLLDKKGKKFPELLFIPTEVGERVEPQVTASLVKEYFYHFTKDSATIDPANSDVIILRIYENNEHESPLVWYAKNRINPSLLPTPLLIDGFPGLRDPSGYYISIPVLDETGATIAGRVFNFTTNRGASGATKELFEILAGPRSQIHFVTSLTDEEQAKKLRRDSIRNADIRFLSHMLEKYKDRHCSIDPTQPCFPTLSAGSFIRGQTISGWGSWTQEFGKALGASMPFDPLQLQNKEKPLGECNPGYDPKTCWSDTQIPKFQYGDSVESALDSGIHAYSYTHIPRTGDNPESYSLCVLYEYPSSPEKRCMNSFGAVQSTPIVEAENQSPTITVVSPQQGTPLVVTVREAATVQVNAVDPDGDIARTEIYLSPVSDNSRPLSVRTTALPHVHSLNHLDDLNLTSEVHEFLAVAIDSKGARSAPAPFQIRISEDAVVTILKPEQENFVIYSDTHSLPMEIEAQVDKPDIIESLIIRIDAENPITLLKTDQPYKITKDIASLLTGSHFIRAFTRNTDGKSGPVAIKTFRVVSYKREIGPPVTKPPPTQPPGSGQTAQSKCVAIEAPDFFIQGDDDTFTAKIKMRNTGQHSWLVKQAELSSVDDHANTTWGTARLPMTKATVPGKIYEFSSSIFSVPKDRGTYTFAWQMQSIEPYTRIKQLFGEKCTKTIEVRKKVTLPSLSLQLEPPFLDEFVGTQVKVTVSATDPDGIATIELFDKSADVLIGKIENGDDLEWSGTKDNPSLLDIRAVATDKEGEQTTRDRTIKFIPKESKVKGKLEEIKQNAVTKNYIARGWAYDAYLSIFSIKVEMRVDGVLEETITTTQQRNDINSIEKIQGKHGFAWTIPEKYYDNTEHTLTVHGIDVLPNGPKHELVSSPKKFTITSGGKGGGGGGTSPPPKGTH